MRRRRIFYLGLIVFGLLVFPMAAFAGGWALVTLDKLPDSPRAGETLSLGFMVRQHGKTPIDTAFGEKMIPRLRATNTDTGATITADARKDGHLGHFVVDVTFPSGGNWEWQIAPEPFQPTRLGTITILPAAATVTEPAPVAQPAQVRALAPSTLRLAGGLLVLAAVALAFTRRRGTPSIRRASST